MLLVLLSIATIVLQLVTWLPLTGHPHWIIRSFEFARLQFATLAGLLLVALLCFLDLNTVLPWVLIAATVLCLIWQMSWILPYTRLSPVEVVDAGSVDPDRLLRIMTANVLITNRDSQKLIELVRQHQPDIFVTLESDHWWQDQLDVLEFELPHTIKCAMDNGYGMHVYARLPLSEVETKYLVEHDKPSMHALLTLRSGDVIRAHFLHPAPPFPSENPTTTERDAELITVARMASTSRYPVIVTGDFNDVAWSPSTRLFRKISGLLDPRVGRGMFNTFHAIYPWFRWPLDYLFHSRHFTLVSLKRLPRYGSDHFALFTELAYAPSRLAEQEGLKADADDHAQAQEIMDEEPEQ